MGSTTLAVFTGILILSFYLGRISPNGFKRDFPLSLILFSQIWVALKLASEFGCWVGIAFGFAFLNAFIVLLGIFELKWSPEGLNKRIEKAMFLVFVFIFVIVLFLSAGISEYTKSNLVGFLFGYSLGLILLFMALRFSEVSRNKALRVLGVNACLYYALIGFVLGRGVSWGWGLITALIFSTSFLLGFMSIRTSKM